MTKTEAKHIALWVLIYALGNIIACLVGPAFGLPAGPAYYVGLGQGIFIAIMGMIAAGFRWSHSAQIRSGKA